MTHRERAVITVTAIAEFVRDANLEMSDAAFTAYMVEAIHMANIAASNDELERRRAVERVRDLAMRMQLALEARNTRLEGWLEEMDELLRPGVMDGGSKECKRLAAILDEFAGEDRGV
jgi:hypothetical protein